MKTQEATEDFIIPHLPDRRLLLRIGFHTGKHRHYMSMYVYGILYQLLMLSPINHERFRLVYKLLD